MHTTMSIRDLVRSSSRMGEYDYIDIGDKKTKEYKGVFIPARFADEIKALINKKIAQEKQAELDELMPFVGMCSGDTRGLGAREIKAEKEAAIRNG